MQAYQREFIRFAIERGVLRFGEFTLKSGRTSPYFFNAGLFNSGSALAQLGRFYASAVIESGLDFDVIFGPAYKGIPLGAATAIALAEQHQRDLPWCFNRKEAKDHGEGGTVVGAPLRGKVVIIDDVISAGTSVRESVELIRAQGATPSAVVIALDRQERGGTADAPGPTSATQEVAALYGIPVLSIASLDDLFGFLQNDPQLGEHLPAITEYRRRYGVSR